MKIDDQLIEYLAKLAKLELKPDQKKIFIKHINEIILYVSKIQKLRNGEELFSPIKSLTNYREDIVEEFDTTILLDNAPETRDRHIKVKAVLKNEV